MRRTTRRTILAATTTAAGALGLLVAPTPVHAAPACKLYGFAGPVTIKGNGAFIQLSFTANGTSATGGQATAMTDKGGTVTGSIAGGIIENGPGLLLTFIPDGGPTYTYNGSIRETDLIATGTQGGSTWSTEGPLACLESAAAPNDGTAEVTEDTDMYDAPGGTGNKYPGFLPGGRGERVPLISCNDENWCNVIAAGRGPVWVWGGHIKRD